MRAEWAPQALGGDTGRSVGRELVSRYISGVRNTTVTLALHEGSIPHQPGLGRALAGWEVVVPMPRLGGPPSRGGGGGGDGGGHDGDGDGDGDGDDDDDAPPRFIADATMHLFTSTADFTLLSPLQRTTLTVTDLDATAYYKGDEVARIQYDLPFDVPPVGRDGRGVKSPRLPVDWSPGSVGYDAVRQALGGSLRMEALAWVGVRVGAFEERVWFRGRGIGARIRL